MMSSSLRLVLSLSASAALAASGAAAAYDGVWVTGSSSSAAGAEALELIDKARRSLGEGPELEVEYQTMPMLYKGSEDGILEGPTWGCYWTQNSCAHRTDVARSRRHPCLPPAHLLRVLTLTDGDVGVAASWFTTDRRHGDDDHPLARRGVTARDAREPELVVQEHGKRLRARLPCPRRRWLRSRRHDVR